MSMNLVGAAGTENSKSNDVKLITINNNWNPGYKMIDIAFIRMLDQEKRGPAVDVVW